MTIPATASEIAYAGDGVSVALPIPFAFDTASDILVRQQDASGAIITVTTGFSVSGGGGQSGTLTFLVAPPVGITTWIFDDPASTQTTDYRDNDSFPAESHERALDRVTRVAKRTRQLQGRSVRYPDGENNTDGELPDVATRKGKYLFFDPATGAIDVSLNLAVTTLTQAIIGGFLFPRTAAEIAAGLTPTNFAIPSHESDGEIYPERYSSNDDTALTRAFSLATQLGGGMVRLQPRIYTLTSSKIWPNRIDLIGAGPRSSIVQINGAIAGFTKILAAHDLTIAINISGIGFKGTASGIGAMLFEKCDYVNIDNCRFSDFTAVNAYGIRMVEVFRWWIRATHFENIERRCVVMDDGVLGGCNAGTFGPGNEVIGNNQPNCIALEVVGQDIMIIGNDFEGSSNGSVGIFLNGVEGCQIIHNYVELWVNNAIKADSAALNRRVLIEQNVLNSGSPAVQLNSAGNTNVRVRQNRFPDMGVGAKCVNVGACVNFIECDNDPDLSDITETYTASSTSEVQRTGSYTATLTGVTGTVTGTARWVLQGKVVTLYLPVLTGTSNSTSCTITGAPTAIQPARIQTSMVGYLNNSVYAVGSLQMGVTGTLTLVDSGNNTASFTAANTKGIASIVITYSLD